MGKTLLSVAIAAILSIPAFAQDLIILRNGSSIDAKVIEIDENSVRYKKQNNPDGPTYSVKKESVNEIRYKNGSKETLNQASVQTGVILQIIDDVEPYFYGDASLKLGIEL